MIKRLCSLILTATLVCSLCVAAAAEATPMAPSGLLPLENGGLIISDSYQRALWRQSADGELTRLAGRAPVMGLNGIPVGGYQDGPLSSAAFETPWAVAPYLEGYAVTDTGNHVVRYVGAKTVSTIAGSGAAGDSGGAGTEAKFDGPTGLVAGPGGCLYVADTGNHVIRKIDSDGVVTTYAGGDAGSRVGSLKEARFREPTGLCYQNGVLYIADSGNHRICKIENNTVTVVAGMPGDDPEAWDGFQDGPAATAQFSHPQGITTDGTAIYVADTGNGAVRVIKDNSVSTLIHSGDGVDGLYPVSPRGITLQNGLLWVGDVFARTLFTLDPAVPVPSPEPEPEPTPAPVIPATFSDVPAGAWYSEAVGELGGRGIMGGVGHNQFAPLDPLSRGMFVTIISRLETLTRTDAVIAGKTAFADIPLGAYYADAAAWAADRQIIQGIGGAFQADREITRAELVTMLYRYATASGLDVSTGAQLDFGPFTDSASVPAWGAPALRWSYSVGLLGGKPGGMLAPLDAVTRGEAAVLLQRYLIWAKR